MKITSRCEVCSTQSNDKECPNCTSADMYTVYVCDTCGKAWFFRNSEKECCKKKKEEENRERK